MFPGLVFLNNSDLKLLIHLQLHCCISETFLEISRNDPPTYIFV